MSNIIASDPQNQNENTITEKEVDKKGMNKNINLNNEEKKNEKFEDTSYAFQSYQESMQKFRSNFPSIFGNSSSFNNQKKDLFDVEFPDVFGDEKKDIKKEEKPIMVEQSLNDAAQNSNIIQGNIVQ